MPRLDAVLVEKGLARSRERAKEMIKSGAVTVDGVTVKKPAAEVTGDEVIESAEKELFVGRGALKLQKAIECFHIDLT
ncbi:MAG: TlyA family RNA methyltransferase, partial [Ruminococcus sp.]|nr:TlyA family RNA methyltransferase [Ruminococcus sp.]